MENQPVVPSQVPPKKEWGLDADPEGNDEGDAECDAEGDDKGDAADAVADTDADAVADADADVDAAALTKKRAKVLKIIKSTDIRCCCAKHVFFKDGCRNRNCPHRHPGFQEILAAMEEGKFSPETPTNQQELNALFQYLTELKNNAGIVKNIDKGSHEADEVDDADEADETDEVDEADEVDADSATETDAVTTVKTGRGSGKGKGHGGKGYGGKGHAGKGHAGKGHAGKGHAGKGGKGGKGGKSNHQTHNSSPFKERISPTSQNQEIPAGFYWCDVKNGLRKLPPS